MLGVTKLLTLGSSNLLRIDFTKSKLFYTFKIHTHTHTQYIIYIVYI